MNHFRILIVILSLTIFSGVVGANEAPLTIDGSSEESLQKSFKTVKQSLSPNQQKKFEQAYFIILGQALDKKGGEIEAFLKALNGKTGPEVIAEVTEIVQDKVRRVQEQEAKKTTYQISDWVLDERRGVIEQTSLSCTALLRTRIRQSAAFPSDEENYRISDESFILNSKEIMSLIKSRRSRVEAVSGEGADKLAIKIKDKTISFITQASVKAGIAEPSEFSIIRNDKNALLGIFLDDAKFPNDTRNSFSVETFLLNKQSGLAIWNKSTSRGNIWLGDRPIPENQSYFLLCR